MFGCKPVSVCCVAIMLAGVGAIDAEATTIQSTFGADADGWGAVELNNDLGNPPPIIVTYPVDWSATGGNPAGFISRTDIASNWLMFSAPAKFLGDLSAFYGGTLAYDLRDSPIGTTVYPGVVLVGGSATLFYDTAPPGSAWTNRTIPLSPTGWRLNDYRNGSAPSPAEMMSVLSSVSAIYIDADWTLNNDVTGLDNVSLTTIPEPSSLSLLGISAISLLVFARRRRAD